MTVVVVARPAEEDGMSVEEAFAVLCGESAGAGAVEPMIAHAMPNAACAGDTAHNPAASSPRTCANTEI